MGIFWDFFLYFHKVSSKITHTRSHAYFISRVSWTCEVTKKKNHISLPKQMRGPLLVNRHAR
jgi:hypothetical protein